MSTNDQDLLRDYAKSGSEGAFAELVARYTDLVYSAALRQVRYQQLAEEVTQSVFVLLARKAAGLAPAVILSGWLLRSTHFVAMDLLKNEWRRQKREQLAAALEEPLSEPELDSAWKEILPVLDESLSELPEGDREVLALRFFEQKKLGQVGLALGVSEEAAKKRVARALDRLRELLQRRKAVLPVTVLATVLSANAVSAAPAGLAALATKAALAAGMVSSAGLGASLSKRLFHLSRSRLAAVCTAVLILPIVWQSARLVSIQGEQHRLEVLLASLGAQARDLSDEQAEVNRQLLQGSNSLARLQALEANATAQSMAGAGTTNLDPQLFLWHEQEDYVRVPKSVLDWVGFDGKGQHPTVGAEADGERVIERNSGQVSKTLLDALGLNEDEQAQVQECCSAYVSSYRAAAEARSYLTNAQPTSFKGQDYFKINADSRVWVTPAAPEDGARWQTGLNDRLAEAIGKDRARIIMRQAGDDHSLSRCFDGFGVQDILIGATPLPGGRINFCGRKENQGEIVNGITFTTPFRNVLDSDPAESDDQFLRDIGYPVPEALKHYLLQWEAAHASTGAQKTSQ